MQINLRIYFWMHMGTGLPSRTPKQALRTPAHCNWLLDFIGANQCSSAVANCLRAFLITAAAHESQYAGGDFRFLFYEVMRLARFT